MGRHRLVPAAAGVAAKSLRRLLADSCVNQLGLQDGSSSGTAKAGSCIGTEGLSFTRHLSANLCRENNRKLASQLQRAQVGLYRTFSQSSVQLAKHSTQDAGGKKKRSGKTAAEIASHNALTQMRPIVFECRVCTAISVTRILKDPYDRGVTIVRCMDCRSPTLISDQLGLFSDPGSMQKFLTERGVDLRNGPEGRYELTPENLVQTQQLEASAAGS